MNAVFRSKQTGQSIPLIALMMVLLFAMVGLSVDVGNTYAEQRTSVRASNAAAIAAMDAVIKGYDDTGVAQIIRESLKSNGLKITGTDNSRRVLAYYMDVEGKGISNCQVGTCGRVPSNVNYVQVSVDGKVDTYFARVVGTSNLPVNATAFSGRCAPTNGVYPIAISNGDLDANGFTRPPGVSDADLPNMYGTYRDDNYPAGKPWRRLSLKRNAPTLDGNFTWLRWSQADWSNGNLAAGLSGEGNLAAGFEEAAWPTGTDPKPTGYPLGPGGLSVGDLVSGNPSTEWTSGDGVHTAVKTLLNNRTLVLLPIIDKFYGTGSDSRFKVTRLGKFYIVNATGSGGISPSSSNGYIDLVYLGAANESACLVTNVDPVKTGTPPTDAIEVRIPFQVKPRWRGTDNPGLPVAYQLVVDVSGSMSLDFKGDGTLGGTVVKGGNTTGGRNVHCEYSSPPTANPYDDSCQGGPNSSWWENSMRRVSITKAAIREFVNALGPNDTMRYTAFSTRGDNGFSGNTQVVPANGYTNNKALLLSELDALGSLNGDPNRTMGGTPGAQALNKAKSIMLAAPTNAPYRKVIVYLTDGVANVFLNGDGNTARDICSDITENAARNSPRCQVGWSTSKQMWRPITAMINEATAIKNADPTVQIYVVALAGVATDGLKDVASSPSMMYAATTPGVVNSILATIRAQSSGSTCLRQGGADWKYQINDANWGEFAVAPYNVPRTVYGKATIYNENGTAVVATADITNDAESNRMGIRANLPPGVYQLEAWVGYKGPDQPSGISRVYRALSKDQTTTFQRISIEVKLNASLNSVQILPDVYADLESTIDVCAP